MESPPYMYWTLHEGGSDAGTKVLVTEITHTSIPTPRQVANGDIFVGRVDKYWGRSYVRRRWSAGVGGIPLVTHLWIKLS